MSTPRTKSLKRHATPAPKQTTPKTAADAQPVEQPRRTKHYVQPDVLDLIRRHNGEPVTLNELTRLLEVPEKTIQHAVLQLMKSVPQIQVVTKGQVWRWDSTTFPEKNPKPVSGPPQQEETVKVYTSVGKAGNGDPIVRDYEDNLYRVVPL